MEKIEDLQNIIKKQEQVISNLTRDYTSIFEHSRVGIVFVDYKGNFIDVNETFCELVKYEKDELLSSNFKDITFYEDLEKDSCFKEQSNEQREKSVTLEKRYLRKDGKIVWVEVFINHIYDEENNFLHSLAFITNINKRKKIQNTILKQTKTMQLYLDIVDVMIIVINKDGIVTLVNRKSCEILGFEEYQIVGKNWFKNFVDESDYQEALDSYITAITKNGSVKEKLQYKVKCKNGNKRDILWRKAFIYNDKKNISGVVSSGEDITDFLKLEEENKRNEEALFNQSKLASMGEMLRNIAHQWRQPLSTISTAASGVKLQKELDVLSDEEFESSMTAIVETTQYLSQTINDFQNFFKMDKLISEFSCKELFERIKNLISSSFKTYNIELKAFIHCGNCVFNGPYNEIVQVLLNILNNAKDAFEDKDIENRVVIVNQDFTDDYLCITIKDNAGGIDEAIIDRVFEPYFTTKHQSMGTGIGLYMSKDIIENRLDGSIEVYNEILEYEKIKRKGAVFKITIPNR